jgi:hypothetical protein
MILQTNLKVLPLELQNGNLFGNRVTEDMVNSDEVILE